MEPVEKGANGVTGLERVGLELTWYYDCNNETIQLLLDQVSIDCCDVVTIGARFEV